MGSLTGYILAIDPGKTGGAAEGWGSDKTPVPFGPLGYYPDEVLGRTDSIQHAYRVVIEAQRGTGRKSDFVFGVHYGRILAHYHGHPRVELIDPQRWQRGLGVRGMAYADRKKRLREIAAARFPEIKVTAWNADALLLWDWARNYLDK